mgnify:CR=1 FL=1
MSSVALSNSKLPWLISCMSFLGITIVTNQTGVFAVFGILPPGSKSSGFFTLIGYSGGGAIASLTATQREDINTLVTVAGNLDILKWTTIHNISRLDESLNPADYTKKLENIKQYHLIGKEDEVIPKEVFLSYLSKFQNKDNITYKYYDASHNCCWKEQYKKFL